MDKGSSTAHDEGNPSGITSVPSCVRMFVTQNKLTDKDDASKHPQGQAFGHTDFLTLPADVGDGCNRERLVKLNSRYRLVAGFGVSLGRGRGGGSIQRANFCGYRTMVSLTKKPPSIDQCRCLVGCASILAVNVRTAA